MRRGARWRRAPGLLLGLLLFGIVALPACVPGLFTSIDPLRLGGSPLAPPSGRHVFGTDELGRDVWSNVVHGARTSLWIGVLATLLATGAGAFVGALAGLHGGWWDEGLMRAAEVFQIIPRILLALLFVALFGGSAWTLVPVIAVTGWPTTARIVRAELLSLREREFALAGRAIGSSDARLLWRHLLPNVLSPVLIGVPLHVGRAILLEAGLNFLGLGHPGVASWGRLLQSAQGYMRSAWWLALFPGAALTTTILALYLIAEGVHVATTPALARFPRVARGVPAASEGGVR